MNFLGSISPWVLVGETFRGALLFLEIAWPVLLPIALLAGLYYGLTEWMRRQRQIASQWGNGRVGSRTQESVRFVRHSTLPTKEALELKRALEAEGITVYQELYDGHKTVDLALPRAKLNIEVDGIQHLTNPHQILADLNRGFYSHKDGYDTLHIPNVLVRTHLREIASALAEAARIRERKIRVHLD